MIIHGGYVDLLTGFHGFGDNMIFVFKDKTKKAYEFGANVRGIHHNRQRPIGLTVTVEEILDQVEDFGRDKVETYIYTVLKPALTVGGRIYLK